MPDQMTALLGLIELDFDPLLQIGALTLRWQTIGVTVALLLAIGVAVLLIPKVASAHAARPAARALRVDQMLLIVLGIVPGAVVAGRLVHVLVYLDAYAADPARVIDPAVGTLSLLGAVVGGTLSALYVARVLGAPVRAWADVAAVPLLVALGLGKLAQLLGGSGQGLPFDGQWAVAFTGAGPWVSNNPQIPSHPAQVYEGIWLLVGIPVVLVLARAGRGKSGRLFFGALAWFFVGRVLVGFTWRDPRAVGLFDVEQLLAMLALGVTLVLASRVIVGPKTRHRSAAAQEPPT